MQGNTGLVVGEGAHLVPVHGFQLKVREGAKTGAQSLGDAEIRLGEPEANVAVDVVDGGNNRRVAGNEVGSIAGNTDR